MNSLARQRNKKKDRREKAIQIGESNISEFSGLTRFLRKKSIGCNGIWPTPPNTRMKQFLVEMVVRQ